VRPQRGSSHGDVARPAGRSAGSALEAVAAVVRAEGGLLAAALGGPPSPDGTLGALSAGREADVAFVVEAIREGDLLHGGRPRLFATDDDDLALLAGDRLYALGLERLAALGDVEAVRELADVISLCAQARQARAPELAEAAWAAGVAAVGWGSTPALEKAKAAARRGDPDAAPALRAAARQLCGHLAPGR
jgi:hypothetical protein